MTLEKELLELEEEMWRANREGDGAFYDRMLRDDALAVSRYGVIGKDTVVPMVQANQNPFIRSEISDARVLPITGDSALVTYRAAYTALIDGQEEDFEVLATSVYARVDGQWRSVLHQQSSL